MKFFRPACRLLCIGLGFTGTVTSAKDPPSAHELIEWTACLKGAGVNPVVDRSTDLLEAAFETCSAQEKDLRRAIARDPSPVPAEYTVDNMKRVLRMQMEQVK